MTKQETNQPQQPKRKIGEGVAQAALRQGFKELGNVTDAFPQGTLTVDEPGQMFNIPPQGVSQQTGYSQPVSVDRSPKPSLIDKHLGDIGVSPNAPASAAMQTPQAPEPANPSLIDQHLQDVRQTSPSVHEPNMEMDK